jgi:hypothetical protein
LGEGKRVVYRLKGGDGRVSAVVCDAPRRKAESGTKWYDERILE